MEGQSGWNMRREEVGEIRDITIRATIIVSCMFSVELDGQLVVVGYCAEKNNGTRPKSLAIFSGIFLSSGLLLFPLSRFRLLLLVALPI